MTEVICVGEALVALVADEVGPLHDAARFSRHVAGAESNVAIALARLGHQVSFLGVVGADAFGDVIIRKLRAEGVDTHLVRRDCTAATGVIVRERRGLGASQVIYHRRDSAGSLLGPDDVMPARQRLAGAALVHVSGILPLLSATCAAATDDVLEATGRAASFDLNVRRTLWRSDSPALLLGLASRAGVVFGGEDEALLVTGENTPAAAAKQLLGRGVLEVILTAGAGGATAHTADGAMHVAARQVAAVVDVVGAGDAFAAGYLSGRLAGADLGARLALGALCGAAAVTAVGDVTGLPDQTDVERLLLPDAGVIR